MSETGGKKHESLIEALDTYARANIVTALYLQEMSNHLSALLSLYGYTSMMYQSTITCFNNILSELPEEVQAELRERAEQAEPVDLDETLRDLLRGEENGGCDGE